MKTTGIVVILIISVLLGVSTGVGAENALNRPSSANADVTGEGNSTAQAQFHSADYFPLTPNTLWVYQKDGAKTEKRRVLDKKESIFWGGEASIIESSPAYGRRYYTSDDKGILYYGGLSRSGTCGTKLISSPAVTMAPGTAAAGQTVQSQGYISPYQSISCPPGVFPASWWYSVDSTVEGLETVTVPAEMFEVMRLSYRYTVGMGESGSLYLAKGVGMVKEVYNLGDTQTVYELVFTNAGVHDLAVTGITAPQLITFTKNSRKKTSPVKVTIQNRGPYPETIQDETMLASLITLTTTSLGLCPNPVPVVTSTTPRKEFPITLASKEFLMVNYAVTFDCVNDPLRSTAENPNHYDYRFTATVNHVVLDGKPDNHPVDDACPRTVTPPYAVDPYPDGTIKDKGCGASKSDGTFGGEVLTDIVSR